jgi:transport and Golgi organization protein 2
MCTLIIGRDVVAPGTILLAANRDEDPERPSDPPGVLSASPRLIGGRDRRAGGTWLAVRETRAVAAILNRRDRTGEPAPPAPDRRSRGSLVLEVAAAVEDDPSGTVPAVDASAPLRATGAAGLPRAALLRAVAALAVARYAPCTLVFATPEAGWLMALESDGAPRFEPLAAGWHVLTHADLDDPQEPRTARLVRELAGFRPGSLAEAERRLEALLRSHGDPAAGVPAVCLHQGRMVTVSSSSVWLAPGEARYRHAEGRPCEHPLVDQTNLLSAPVGGGKRV